MSNKIVVKRTVEMLKCQRCGHEWKPRKPIDQVKRCAACKSPYWQTPKKG